MSSLYGEILKALKDSADIDSICRATGIGRSGIDSFFKYLDDSRIASGFKIESSVKAEGAYSINIDGGSRGNPGHAGCGIVIKSPDGKRNGYYYYLGTETNNYAEYTALIKALELAIQQGINEVNVYSDSELMCNQIKGLYKVKSPNLKDLYEKSVSLIKGIEKFTINHVYREFNKDADMLANKAMDLKNNGKIELSVAR